ncbi:MAG: O-antigen ligase family protein [Ruminococcaceae bacterium]|nr:O-antigen ligase family protein [Oscillospiraceae bacterium]
MIMIVIRAVVIGYILGGNFDHRDIFKIYTALVMLIISVYLVQWILVAVGVRMSFQFPFLSFSNAYEYLKGSPNFGMNPDPTSLFSERAHLAEYIVPYVAVCLFGKNLVKKYALFNAVVVSIVVLTTVSGTGIVVVLIEWVLFFAGLGQKKSKYRFIYMIAGGLILVAVYFILRQIPAVDTMFDRLFIDNTGNDYSSTKADYRIYRGFDLFTKLPLYGQIFGIGYNHMQLFASINGIVSEFDNENLAYEFFSTIFQIAIYSGFIGIVCAVKHIYHLFKSNSPLAKALIIIMLAMWCSSAMFLTNSHIVMVLLIVSTIYYDNQPTEALHEN